MAERAIRKMRVFFSLWPDESVRQSIIAATGPAVSAAGGRPVPAQNYHVTLAFLGHIRQSSIDDIIKTARSLRFKRFRLRLERTGYWPRSRIAWLGPAQCPMELSALVDDLWNKLEDLGFMNEHRLYQPHVSLCRDVSGCLGAQLQAPIDWSVSSFALVHSLPGPAASSYTVLEQFPAGD